MSIFPRYELFACCPKVCLPVLHAFALVVDTLSVQLVRMPRRFVQFLFRNRYSGIQAPAFRNISGLRVFVVCIQEKNNLNPKFGNNCRLIFTLFIEGEDNPIRILYVTGNDGERGHGGSGFDHIHLEEDAMKCGTAERAVGWPQWPEIVSNPLDRI